MLAVSRSAARSVWRPTRPSRVAAPASRCATSSGHTGGRIFTLGDNVEGQMGIEGASASQVKAIESLPPIKAIAAGHMHSLAVEEAGGVWGFGASTFGETGLGVDLDPGVPPMRIDINVPMVAASAGKSHSMLLSAYGELYSFGDGESFQLGYVAPGSNPTPKKIDALKGVNVKKIICGPIHNFAIDDKGALYSWGSGHYAQHGQGIPDMISTPTPVRALQDNPVELVAAGLYHSVIVTKSQEVLFFGGYKTKPPGSNMHRMNFFLKPTPLKDAALTDPNEQWTHLTAGITHNVLTSSKGRSFAWGLNTSSAVGTDRPSSIDRAVSLDELSGVIFDVLASGPYHNMGIDSSGSVWGWGQGSDFQLAGERRNVTVPTKLSIGLPEDLSVIQIAAGWAHTLILAAPKQSL